MRKIQVLGPGCPKCEALARNAGEAVRELDIQCEIEKVKDIRTIMQFGVMMTPGLVIDGEVKSIGKVLPVEKIKELLA